MSERRRTVVDSEAVQVTFFEDRAEVVRRARCRPALGVSTVAVGGVSAMVDDPTALARIKSGGARVLATQVVREVRNEPEAGECWGENPVREEPNLETHVECYRET